MKPDSSMNGNIREWLENFLNVQGRSGGQPDGRPLYSYQAVATEYQSLIEKLRSELVSRSTALSSVYWAAGFCFFVSEFYRREYDGGTGGWTWRAPEALIGIELDVDQRAAVTKRGLVKYWRREIRTGDGGRQYLGTLYSEGGLPWKLVQSERHGFGRAIRSGLKRHDQVTSLGQSLVGCIERYAHYLPKNFQNTNTYEMLAAIVAELMRITTAYPELPTEAEAAVSFLDHESPGWRRRFPIPLGEANGRELVSTWFTDAARERASSRILKVAGQLTSETILGGSADWALVTTVSFPESVYFDLGKESLISTRLTLSLFEGENRLESLASVYAEIKSERDETRALVRLRQRSCVVSRRSIRQPLSLRAFSQGQPVGVLIVDSPVEDGDDLPLVFEPVDEKEWRWVGCASKNIQYDIARVFIPDEAKLGSSVLHELIEPDKTAEGWTDGQCGVWIDLYESATINTRSGSVYLRLRELAEAHRPTLVGVIDRRDTLPNLSYIGFPSVQASPQSEQTLGDFDLILNDKPLSTAYTRDFVGTANLVVSAPQEGLLLRRRFGVLPKDLRVYLQLATGTTPARLTVRTAATLIVGVQGEGLRTETVVDSTAYQFKLYPVDRKVQTLIILIHLTSDDRVEPVVVRLPFPQCSALLIGPDSMEIESNQLSIGNLLGTRLVLGADGPAHRHCHVSFTFEGRRGRKLELHQKIEVGNVPVSLPLHAWREDWMRMLSASSDQDDYIRVDVESDRLLKRFSVRRFDAKLKRHEEDRWIMLSGFDEQAQTHSVVLLAMDVTAPERAPVRLEERLTELAGTGLYQLPEETKQSGPWLIFADESSSITVRPYFVASCEPLETARGEDAITPLHEACARFDHKLNSSAIDDVISVMAMDLGHPGWSYLQRLRNDYRSLPLSSFEAWRSVAKSPKALVATLMKLESDANFVGRLSNELAVVWEEVPLSIWGEGIQTLRFELDKKHGDSGLTQVVISSRLKLLEEAIPCVAEFIDQSTGRVAIQTTNAGLHEHLLRLWHKELLVRQAHNDHWPDLLRKPLQRWFESQTLMPRPQAFLGEFPGYAFAVSILPLFMAAVTTEKVSLESLDSDPEALRFDVRVLADFDRSWYEPVYMQTLALLSLNDE